MEALNWLAEPLEYGFFLRALAATAIAGLICSVLGVYVVLRGMAFFGEALAHTILPGVVAAFLLGWPLALGALLMGVFTAVGISALSRRGHLKEDTAIGVFFAGALALGVAMLSASPGYSVDLAHFLFGNLLGVSVGDLALIGGLSLVALLTVVLLYKELLVITFDPVMAATLRLPAAGLNFVLLILLALTVVISLQVVGVSLIIALLVTPPAAASLLTRRLPSMMLVAAGLGTLSGVLGLYASYYLNIASGPAVVLVATLFFLLAFLFAPGKGVLAGRRAAGAPVGA
ncbi:MAG: metal ABC transporter permease [Candidatus Promineifilaceae bacterium]